MNELDKARGLYPRYHITKTSGKKVDPNAEYFVLRLDEGGSDPAHIAACRKAIQAYASAIAKHIPHLASDLWEKYPTEGWKHMHWPDEKLPERIDPP